jgi:putative nucleotidyltransferase with HDIG domain
MRPVDPDIIRGLLEDSADGHVGVLQQSVESLLEAVYRKDAQIGKHSWAVAHFAGLVGRELGLVAYEMRTLLVGALLHDVGKVFVPDAILKKPGSLSPKERMTVQMHPVTGSRILEHSVMPVGADSAVRHHHERYDGRGYPRRLRAKEIPLAARIIQVADTFDAMTRSRSYRRGISPADGLEELTLNSGTQFDPEVVWVFVAAMTRLGRFSVRWPRSLDGSTSVIS